MKRCIPEGFSIDDLEGTAIIEALASHEFQGRDPVSLVLHEMTMSGTLSKAYWEYRHSFMPSGAVHDSLMGILSLLSHHLITLACVSARGFHETMVLSLQHLQFPVLTELIVYHSEISMGNESSNGTTTPLKFPALKYFHVAFTVGDLIILRQAPALTHLRFTGDFTTLAWNLAGLDAFQNECQLERVGLSFQNDFRILTNIKEYRRGLRAIVDVIDPIPDSSGTSDEVGSYGYDEVDADWRRGVERILPYWVARITL
ncbi:hypothetical protein NLI96_g9941 [Meripilus lineatus]|uniref:Uncharacterized protein n=1 Tax=Meripilus lineatus TaxID=2056292 RepID=A0AAD5YCG5_9APHY|nr:hypothetical protein NLI96_g9941 [Physisporinus lineatus]